MPSLNLHRRHKSAPVSDCIETQSHTRSLPHTTAYSGRKTVNETQCRSCSDTDEQDFADVDLLSGDELDGDGDDQALEEVADESLGGLSEIEFEDVIHVDVYVVLPEIFLGVDEEECVRKPTEKWGG